MVALSLGFQLGLVRGLLGMVTWRSEGETIGVVYACGASMNYCFEGSLFQEMLNAYIGCFSARWLCAVYSTC